MKLKLKKIEVGVVEYSDLDDFINHHFPDIGFEFIPDEEMSNDSMKRINVDGILEDYQEENMEREIKERNTSYMTSHLLNKLCKDGLLKKGIYIIDVCW